MCEWDGYVWVGWLHTYVCVLGIVMCERGSYV